MSRQKAVSLLLFVLFAAFAAGGQEHPNVAKGFSAEKAYDGGLLDSINLFNGNLNLVIPLGQVYSVSPTLSYQFNLVHAGNNWDMEENEHLEMNTDGHMVPGTPRQWFAPSRAHDINAGFGWRVSLGSIHGNTYLAPDGSRHEFHGSLRGDLSNPDDPDPGVSYMRDGTFLRRRVINDTTYEIDFPNGNVHRFSGHPHAVLTQMRDAFGNVVNIDAPPFDENGRATWTITDPFRTHTISLERMTVVPDYSKDPNTFTVIREIRLASFGGTAVYRFEYLGDDQPAHRGGRISRRLATGLKVMQDCDVPGGTVVPLLSRVILPGAEADAYTFEYDRGDAHLTDTPSFSSPGFEFDCGAHESFTGSLTKMTLPTRGAVEWKYRLWRFPVQGTDIEPRLCPSQQGVPGPCIQGRYQNVVGVGERFDRGAGNEMLSKRTYTNENFSGLKPHTGITTVTEYALKPVETVVSRTLQYHSLVSENDEALGFDVEEYSLPFTRAATDPDTAHTPVPTKGPWPDGPHATRNGLLSSKTYDAAWKLLRYTYLTYESDGPRLSETSNRRVKNQSVVNVEDNGKWWTTTLYSNYDFLGHYRTTERVGSVAPNSVQRTTTNYNPGSSSTSPMPAHWILGTYPSTVLEEVENGAVVDSRTTLSCFDPTNGFLKATRAIRGASAGRNDFLTVYTPHATMGGSVVGTEAYYGGDETPLPESFGTGCTGVPPAARYTISHQYAAGVRRESKYSGVAFKSLDLEIDAATGLVKSSTDPAGRKTTYGYDIRGRIREQRPPGAPWTKYEYDLRAPNGPTAIVRQFAFDTTSPVLTESRHHYDGMGRMLQQKRLMPGDKWSTTTQEFDALGRKEFSSVAAFTTDPGFTANTAKTTQYVYDALGRTMTVIEPDQSRIEQRYLIAASDPAILASHQPATMATRTVKIATVANEGGENVTTTEWLDQFGRLVKVEEPSGPNGEPTHTRYRYDLGGSLEEVSMSQQTRTFLYDGAGMLREEDHPEGNKISYSYDARGHVVTKSVEGGPSLRFTYDAAERPLKVIDAAAAKDLKIVTYDTAEAGQVATQARKNYFPDTVYTVTDAFTYDPPTGRVVTKKTSIQNGTEAPLEFIQNFDFNELGLPKHVKYPTCATCGGVATSSRDLVLDYQYGLLTGIAGVTTKQDPSKADSRAIDYAPSGVVERVQHATATGGRGILDEFVPDADGMARFSSISFTPAVACPGIDAQPQDVTVISGGTAQLAVGAPAGATVVWFEGMPGDETKKVGEGPILTIPNVTSERFFWCKVTVPGAECSARSRPVRVGVTQPCITAGFPLQMTPTTVVEGASFRLQAPEVAGATYKWFRGTPENRVLVNTTTVPFADMPGIHAETQFIAEITSSCTLQPVASAIRVVKPCLKPLQRGIHIAPLGGDRFRLFVDADPADAGEVTFQWFQAFSNIDTTKPAGTGPSIEVTLTSSSGFWVRMTRVCNGVPAVTVSEVVIVDPGCLPFIFQQPQSASSSYSVPVNATVRPGGPGPNEVHWFAVPVRPEDPALASGETYTWTYDGPAGGPTGPVAAKVVRARVRRTIIKDGVVTGHEDVWSNDVTLRFVPTPQRIASYTEGHNVYSPSEQEQLSVTMDPPAAGEDHKYTYSWYVDDGTPAGALLNNSGPSMTAKASMGRTFWVVINGTHRTAPKANGTYETWTETTVSKKMHLFLYGQCDIPPVRIEQSVFKSCEGPAPNVTFRAICDWHDVRYQWFAGDPGDTRNPLTPAPVHDNELTIYGNVLHKVWVRASLECGAFSDSDVAVYRRGDCEPLFLTPLQSIDIPWDTTATLSVNAVDVSRPGYQWYEGNTQILDNGNNHTLTRPNRRKSGRFKVDVRDMDCNNSLASSNVATVRIASAPGITPPVWPSVVWTAAGTAPTLSALSTGATGGYQWFAGEVGDESGIITGQTGATFTPPPLTADARYWARVKRSDGPQLDSPTITVKVCDAPRVTTRPTFNHNIIPGQVTWFSVNASGTGLQYQWYEGQHRDKTKPVGQPVEGLKVSPDVTKKYWLEITGRCGDTTQTTDEYIELNPDGTVKSRTPLVFTASVCPSIASVSTTTPKVMPGTPAKLSVSVTGTSLNYVWYIGQPGDLSQPIPNSDSATFTTPPVSQTTTFFCRVISGTCKRNSEAVTVSVCDGPTVRWNTQTRDKVELNQQHVIGIDIDATDPVTGIQFYEGVSGDLANSTPIGPGGVPGQSVIATATKQYWARVKMGNCHGDSPALTVSVCIPKITAHPQSAYLDRSANPTGSATLTVNADISPVTVQWYTGASGDVSAPIAGQTAKTLVVSPTADTTYWARVTGSCGQSKDSTAATVTVCNPPAISNITGTRTIVSGNSTSLTVTATGTELTYQWYRGAAGVTTNPAGTGPTITVSPTATTTYWCRITSRGKCSVDSALVTVNVCNPPAITTQPVSQKVFSGTPVTLSVTATASGAMTYQWYTGASGTTTSPISGATSASLTVNPASTTSYWVRVTTSICTTDSAAATVSHCTYAPVWAGGEKKIGYNESTSLSLPPTSPVYDKAITWYRGNVGDRSAPVKSGTASNLTYDTPPLTQTTLYWAEFVHEGCTTRTDVYTVNVCKPSITTQPANKTIASGSSTTLSVAATPISGQTYQWYTGTPGTTTNPIAGATSASLSVSPTATTSYWVRVSGPCGLSADSAAATVTVCTPPSIAAVNTPRLIESGDFATLSVSATGSSLTYQWYTGTSGTTTSPIAGATSASISVSPTTTTSYWCRVTSAGVCTANSGTIVVDVCTAPVVNAQPASQRIFRGTPATLAFNVISPRPVSYQWYAGASGSTANPISGATSSTLTVSPTSDSSYWARATVAACRVDSATAVLSMCTYGPTIDIPSTRNIFSNENTTLSFPALSPVYDKRITWYRGASGDRSNPVTTAASATSLDYTTPKLTQNTQYWVEFEHNGCITVSNTLTVQVCKPTITAHPQSATVLSGTPKTLSVTSTGSPLTYQWYRGNSGDTTQPIAGAVSASYTATPSSTTSYWVRATGCATTADSTAATITVCTRPVVTLTKSNISTPGLTGTVTANVTGGTNLTFQWFKGMSGDTSRPIVGATASAYQFTTKESEYYWVRVTSGCDGTVTDSEEILYSVQPKITENPDDASICRLGDPATFTVTATGTFLTYEWRRNGTLLEGQTRPTLTIPIAAATDSFYVTVHSGTASVRSLDADVILNPTPTISSISKTATSSTNTYYRLNANIPETHEAQGVTFQWFQGPLGDTTTPLAVPSTDSYITVRPTPPVTYWVRVTFTATGCFSDKATSF